MAGNEGYMRIGFHAYADSAGGFGISGKGGDLAVGRDFSAGDAFHDFVDGIAEGVFHQYIL